MSLRPELRPEQHRALAYVRKRGTEAPRASPAAARVPLVCAVAGRSPQSCTCTWRRLLVLGALLCAAATRLEAANPASGLRRAIDGARWQEASTTCERLPATEARRLDIVQLPASHYAELAALCAAAASGGGDPERAGWWWFTALAMDSTAAAALLPELRAKGLLVDLPPPRRPSGGDAPHKMPRGDVRLPTGEAVSGQMVKVVERPRPPEWVSLVVPGVRRTEVVVELLIGADGVARQPALVSAKALPIHAFQAFAYLHAWRFEAAKVQGQPTAAVFPITLTIHRTS